MKIDFDDFEVIIPELRKPMKQVVSVFEDGSLSVNEALVKGLKTNQFEIRLDKKEQSKMLLIPNGKEITDMGKNNRIKNYAIVKRLEKKKIKFPIYYVGDWDEESKCWIGELSLTNPNKSAVKIKK